MRVFQTLIILVSSTTTLLSTFANASTENPVEVQATTRGYAAQQQQQRLAQTERKLNPSSTGFYVVDSGTSNLTPLDDESEVIMGDFHFTYETDNSDSVAHVDFSLSMTSDIPEDYSVVGSTFFDAASTVSQTPGSYTLVAQPFDSIGAALPNSTVDFEIVEPPPPTISPGPSSMPSRSPSMSPSASSVPTLSPSAVPSSLPTPTFQDLRIMVGSTVSYNDTFGRVWTPDQYYVGGAIFQVNEDIFGTENDAIYQQERYSSGTSSVVYEIPVDGDVEVYDIVLHFCELYFVDENRRVFDIVIEGETVKEDHDTLAESGGRYIPLVVPFEYVNVTDGNVSIELVDVKQNAALVAIEVLAAGTAGAPQQETIFISCGATNTYTDIFNQVWGTDRFFGGTGLTASTNVDILGTLDDGLFQTYRNGLGIFYNIPVLETGDYVVSFYFMDHEFDTAGTRIFSLYIEDQLVQDELDIVGSAGGQFTALKLDFPVSVVDGEVNIVFGSIIGEPTISAIQVQRLGPHLAHSVPGGPYSVVDVDDSGSQVIFVDGSQSHTHLAGAAVVSWTWSTNGTVVGTGVQASFDLSLGEHVVNLLVSDDDGNEANEVTIATVLPYGNPVVDSISPNLGDVEGNTLVTITGSGFNHLASELTVWFGDQPVAGSQITVVNNSTLEVVSPPYAVAIPVFLSVANPIGTSNPLTYTYVSDEGGPIVFAFGDLYNIYGPTAVAFGPNGKLYVGTQAGAIAKLTLDENYNIINEVVTTIVGDSNPTDPYRAILGLVVDPFDTSEDPDVYVSHSRLFHKSPNSFEDAASTNGKVSKVSGVGLTVYEDVVTGLPVSDHDHGINGLAIDDERNLYIQIGGNTNAGVPGSLSSTGLQEDNYFSSGTAIAYLGREGFNGTIVYDQFGYPIGDDVEVFAAGQRNPFGITLHSNGMLYATDNGPNNGYGKKSVTCDTEGPDPSESDKLNLLKAGGFYGAANRQYGECVWRSQNEPSDANYTAPLQSLPSSTNGIVEFDSTHFNSQLRGNLILSKYLGVLFRVVLDETGENVVASAELVDKEKGGLHVTQGPDGTLFVAQINKNKIVYNKPDEPAATAITIKSVWPRRGPYDGGNTLTVYGEMLTVGGTPTVLVDDDDCPVTSSSFTMVECTLPTGSVGKVNVTVTSGAVSTTLSDGYRYMQGPGSPAPTNYPTSSQFPTTPPSRAPSAVPSYSVAPSISPAPTQSPSISLQPSSPPTPAPSSAPSLNPTNSPFSPIYINAGGGAYTDPISGRQWIADAYFSGGDTYTNGAAIANTEEDPVYTIERWSKGVGNIAYEIPLPPNTYDVTLHHCELYFSIDNKRKFDIYIEGNLEVNSFDPWVAAGGKEIAYQHTFSVSVTDGSLSIDLVDEKNNASIVGIQVELSSS